MNELLYIFNSEIYKEVLEDGETYLPKVDALKRTEIPKETELDEFQYYIHEVGYWLFQLDRQLFELNFSIKFLRNFDYSKFNNNCRPNRIDHLDYTIANFYIRYASVKDKCLQLINTTFHIGIHEKDVNEKVIINNLHVNRSIVAPKYKHISKLIEDDLKIRNSIIHKNMYTDLQIHKLRFFYASENSDASKELKLYRRAKLNEYIDQSEDRFNIKFKLLVPAIDEYLDTLSIIYKREKKEFIKMGFGEKI